MTITPEIVQQFEADQRAWGTAIAIHNVLWLKAAEDLQAIGARQVATSPTPRGGRGRIPLMVPKMRAPRR